MEIEKTSLVSSVNSERFPFFSLADLHAEQFKEWGLNVELNYIIWLLS